ncbi:uncharacterized protein H6S33_001371 [Morchella sextelata]|uniref:uncharacterized protein n=1 Tax=Morchella sextelata TaxID=1174677 RepID=UPI001D04D342|nr:uncharacterized protein H6S33_001371 [Morchella sextelata]KAH0609143.1 hypothetical protein H6S33_001371 [Morchella sextelata]
MPLIPKSQKCLILDRPNQHAPILSSVNKRSWGAMSVPSVASSFTSVNSIVSGSTTEADTDFGKGPVNLLESFDSYPEG